VPTAQDLHAKFVSRFAAPPALYRAPGRVNLVGEHTDYNDGFVLPAAIGFSCSVAIAARNDRKLVIYSEAFDSTVEAESEPLPAGLQLVICNTMVKHQLGASEYHTRRAQCEEGVRRLSAALPGVVALRDGTLVQLEQHRALLSDTIYRRCRQVITENDRVYATASALKSGEIRKLSSRLADSHRSMRDDYEISCSELDIMVALAAEQPGVYGARMTGGGFGGCTVNLIATEHASVFRHHMAAEYHAATGLRPDIYTCEAAQGAEVIASNFIADDHHACLTHSSLAAHRSSAIDQKDAT
jgi:galactokinase